MPARGQPEPHRLARHGHRVLERDVARVGGIQIGEVGQVHAVEAAVEVLEDRVGHERRERREQLGDLDEGVLERAERGRVSVPEAAPRAPHVPVREIVDIRRDRLAGARRVVVLHPLAHLGDRRVQARDRPAVELGLRLAHLHDLVRVRVEDVEPVGVPELQQELAHRLADVLGRELVAVPRLLGRQVVPAERVGPVALDDLPRHDDVPERLGHLLALRVGDVAEDEHGPVRRAVEQQRRDRDQRVEPAAGLVDRLADVVGRERGAELLLVLERGVALGERHRARVEPDVDHLGHAAHLGAALRAGPRVLVDVRPVRVGQRAARALLELRERADRLGVAVLAAPDGQGRAPVALARDRPVDVVLQPLAEAAVLDVRRVPLDRLVGGEQPVAQRRRADVPGRLGVVEQRRPAAPAVRVGVQDRLRPVDPPARAQVLDQVRVGVLDPAACVGADPLVVGAVEPDGVDHRRGPARRRAGSRPRRMRSRCGRCPCRRRRSRSRPAPRCGPCRRTPRSGRTGTAARSRPRASRRPGSGRRSRRPRRARAPPAPRRGPRRSRCARRSGRGRRRARRSTRASTGWSSTPAACRPRGGVAPAG